MDAEKWSGVLPAARGRVGGRGGQRCAHGKMERRVACSAWVGWWAGGQRCAHGKGERRVACS
eukprot:364412-Chlamydomonas_euryale.AAC.8